jgi:hypothetical protein
MSKQTIALAYTRPADALEESDYQALVEALSETARGRGFLAEHARRSRGAETNILLTAIERIEAQVRPRSPAPEPLHDDLRRVLDEVRAARARVEAGGAAPKLEQLAALLDLVQRRLTTLLAPPPAAGQQPATRPLPQTAPATPPRPAAARWLEEPLTPPPAVNDAGPPQRPAITEAAAPPPRVIEIEAEIQAMVAAKVESKTMNPNAPPDAAEPAPTMVVESADDALAAIMALSEEERIALFT